MQMIREFRLESSDCSFYTWMTKAPDKVGEKVRQMFKFQGYHYFLCLKRFRNSYKLHIYCMEIHPKAFDVTVFFGDGTNYISYPKKTINRQGHIRIWKSNLCNIKRVIPTFEQRSFLHFKIELHFSDPSVQQLKTDEKSIQTPPYLDAHLSSQSLSQDLEKLMEIDSDLSTQIICGKHTFKAHKSFLGIRSEVLKGMFQSEMVEGRTGMVQIKDVESTTFEQFLRYVYTGNLPELTMETAKQLYKIGDKYAIEALKKECVSFLLDNLSKNNACEILIFADQHNDPDFKENVMIYILEEKLPTTSDNWQDFCSSHQMLAIEVLNHFCQSLASE